MLSVFREKGLDGPNYLDILSVQKAIADCEAKNDLNAHLDTILLFVLQQIHQIEIRQQLNFGDTPYACALEMFLELQFQMKSIQQLRKFQLLPMNLVTN